MKLQRLVLVILALGIWSVVEVGAWPQQDKAYEPSEIQKLRIQVKFKDAQIAQQQLSVAQQQFNAAVSAFNAQVEATKKENSWPDTVQIDPNTLEFKETPMAAGQKPTASTAPRIGPAEKAAPPPPAAKQKP
jgi:hypothetical protein